MVCGLGSSLNTSGEFRVYRACKASIRYIDLL